MNENECTASLTLAQPTKDQQVSWVSNLLTSVYRFDSILNVIVIIFSNDTVSKTWQIIIH